MQVIAHRGASSYAPENTVPAFDLAIQMGADGLETDIRATSDGVLVLLHDAEVGRTTDGQGPVADLSWEQVSQLDAGSWFAPRFAGARIMTLDEFLERYGGRLSLALEVKAPDIEPLVVQALRGRAWLHQVTVTSFSWQTCWEAHRLMPELRVGWLMRDLDADAIQRAEEAGLAQICPPAEGLTSQWVAQAHARGLEVRAWGVRDEALMRGAVEAGVKGMTVNFPDKLLAHLRARGLR